MNDINDQDTQNQLINYGKDLAKIYLAEKAKREELEHTFQTLLTVLNSSPDGLVVLNTDLSILQANTTFANMINMNVDDIIDQPITKILNSDDLRAALNHNLVTSQNQVDIMLEDSARAIQANIAPLISDNDHGWVISIRDTSKTKLLEKQKTDFINIAAHELRTPLSQILGFTQFLMENYDEESEEQRQKIFGNIEKAGNRLNHIIKELINFAEANHGDAYQEGIQKFDLSLLIKHTISNLSPASKEKNVSITFNDLISDIHMESNPGLIRLVLHNLLLNAINFNVPNGWIRISANKKGSNVHIEVIDGGSGISPEEIKKIFDPLYQIEDHMTRMVGGLGLGLATSKRGVRQLGGSISVESKLGKGSSFFIKIPLEIPSPIKDMEDLEEQLAASQSQTLAYARDVRLLYTQLQDHFMTTLESAIQTIEAKDPYTRGHTERVTKLTVKIGEHMNLPTAELRDLEIAGKIHDIGKIGIPDAILNKPGKLTKEEFEVIRSHIPTGEKIIAPMEFLNKIAPIAFSHHEHWDGKGYPQGLAAEEIPLGGRMMAVADAYDAMTSDRPYRKGMSKQTALDILNKGAGSQWDPKVVDVFLELINTN